MSLPRILALTAFAAGCAALPAGLWWSSTERFTLEAAEQVRGRATPSDLVLVSSSIMPAEHNPAGLMRPFGALAVVVLDPSGILPDLRTFPQQRAFVVGNLPLDRLGVGHAEYVGQGVRQLAIPHAGTNVVALMSSIQVSTESGGASRPCPARHPSGGVRCGGQPWQYVGPVVVPAGDRWISCLWTHPVQDSVLVLDVPAGPGRAALWLQYADETLREPERPPVVASLAVGADEVVRVEARNRGSGRTELAADLPAGTTRVRAMISTADAGRQLVCLGGEVPRP